MYSGVPQGGWPYRVWLAYACSGALFCTSGLAGLTRLGNQTLRMPSDLPIVGFGLTNAVGGLRFREPVAVAAPRGETNRLFVVERAGTIIVITNLAEPSRTTFLDLTAETASGTIESGLLGLAFHPGHSTNGFFYVYRTVFRLTNGLHVQLSRFQTSLEDANRALPESEMVLLTQEDESTEHNAGDLHFGPDGYLYVSLGYDAPPPGERIRTQQPIDGSFFGAILRIDVDKRPDSLVPNAHPASTTNFAIPPDNPFVGATSYQGVPVDPARVRTEFFALGFRNPWRIAFDDVTGQLYCGDVGGVGTEEVNLVSIGRNYGWPYRDGPYTNELETLPVPQEFSPPLYFYSHGHDSTNQGNAVIGGVVYRGQAIPQLYGAYLFGDNVSGHIWALNQEGTHLASVPRLTSDPGISAFGTDPRDGEVLVVNYYSGMIQRLIYVPPGHASEFPQTLADTGAFSDLLTLTASPGVVPYDINVPFWSDHAVKTRWFSIPDAGLKIDFHTEANWVFPPGTVWIKHFEVELTNGIASSRRRLETRMLVKNETGVYGVTYRWVGVTNAVLVPDEGSDEELLIYDGSNVRKQLWRYPSRSDCISCHTPGGGFALGFNTPQLNRTVDFHGITVNQLQALSAAGYFQTNVHEPRMLRALAAATNTAFSIEHRARSYLAANCAQCHHPGGKSGMLWDARISTPRDQSGIINGSTVGKHPHLRILSPGAATNSLLPQRMSYLGPERMPPLGSRVLDTNAITLILDWVARIPRSPWQYEDIGAAAFEGSSTVWSNTCTLHSAARGMDKEADAFHFLHHSLLGNGQILGRITGLLGSDAPAQVGVMVRDGLTSTAPGAWVILKNGESVVFQQRATDKGLTTLLGSAPLSPPCWLRLVREGEQIKGYYSATGSEWVQIGRVQMDLPESLSAGFILSAGDAGEYRGAQFESIGVSTIALAAPDPQQSYVAPTEIALSASVQSTGIAVSKVQFFVGSLLVGETKRPPYDFTWSNVLAGTHSVTAVMVDEFGGAVASQPMMVSVNLPEPLASFEAGDPTTSGNWKGIYGNEGVMIAGDTTNLPQYAQLSFDRSRMISWGSNSLKSALLRASGSGRIAAAWSYPTNFTLDLQIMDGHSHQLTLYFLDWNTDNRRVQTVQLFDAATGALLNAQTLRGFTDGKYRTWAVRGHVQIKFSTSNGYAPVLSGVFFDTHSNAPPHVSLIAPQTAFTLPVPIILTAEAEDEDGQVKSVEFFANDLKLGEVTSAPYVFRWSNALAGVYMVSVRAKDNLGASSESEPLEVTLALPPAHAAFLQVDEITKGSWKKVYGSDGFVIANHATNRPAFAPITLTNTPTFTWQEYTGDASALERVDDASRIAATWYGGDFSVNVPLLDGERRRLSLYFVEEILDRIVSIRLLDRATDRLLDAQEVTSFIGGKYLVWTVQGNVRIEVKRLIGANAVLSALFLDPETNQAPTVRLTKPIAPMLITAPARLLIEAEATDDDGVRKIEFFSDTRKVGEATSSPFALMWDVLSGDYALTARAIDNSGVAGLSAPVSLSVGLPTAEVAFVGVDTNTLGSWRGVYGAEGFYISHDILRSPAYVRIDLDEFVPYAWEWPSVDPRALRRAEAPTAIAAAWVAHTNLSIDLTMADGHPHQVALYCADYDSTQRVQRVSITDAADGRLLDSREIRDFYGGQYWVWNMRGRVKVAVAPFSLNAVFSGIFFDAVPTPFDFWRRQYFSPLELADPQVSGEHADPDGDGIINLLEYALHLDPNGVDETGRPRSEILHDHLHLTFSKSKRASDVILMLEYSTDLTTWSDDPELIESVMLRDDPETETLAVRGVIPVSASTTAFIRMRAMRR